MWLLPTIEKGKKSGKVCGSWCVEGSNIFAKGRIDLDSLRICLIMAKVLSVDVGLTTVCACLSER